MDFAYSPHREGGGMVHLPSPTHHHGYGMEIPSSIQQLRRSLSRSPSKSSRFALRKSDSPASPLSPLALARAFSPKPQAKDNSSMPMNSESPFFTQAAPASTKKRFTLRRSAPFRSSPRNRTTSKSPRRALAESTDHGNATPFTSRRISGEENKHMVRRTSAEILDNPATEQRPSFTYDLDDKPIRFPLSRSRIDLTGSSDIPAKSSPLKRSDRSDGMMNMDDSNAGSPVAKRRSLHGSSAFGENFNVYDYATTPRSSVDEPRTSNDSEGGEGFLFLSSPAQPAQTPARKPSLRKSVGYQRIGANTSRSNQATDGEFLRPGPAASTTRNRMSLDGSLSFSPAPPMLKYRRASNLDPLSRSGQLPFLRGASGSHQPHPLSHALTPASSLSMDGSPSDAGSAAPTACPPDDHPYARSLPIGAARPRPPKGQPAELTCETPNFWMTLPDPAPFNSTGFISKKNRNVDDGDKADYIMPDTPSKRNSYPPLTSSPYSVKRQSVIDFGEGPLSKPQFQLAKTQPQFGQPSTPLTVHRHSTSFGQGVHLFGSYGSSNQRRLSFAGTDGGDEDDNNSKDGKSVSPWGTRMEDSQSSNEDMPPTPTKDGSGRRKDNSLRRSTFRQPRASLGVDTFTAPEAIGTPSIAIPPLSIAPKTPFDKSTPRTPNESFTPPDPSTLSISGRRASVPFNNSIVSVPFEPETPTTPRDHPSMRAVTVTQNDVDETLAARFDTVTSCGDGEFSKVYKVEKRKHNPFGFTSPAKQVWAVKKTKKPFIGPKDRAKHLKEVEILQRLRGHGHVLSIEDSWEAKGYLYIQTEYCDEGNLEHYLAVAGSKSRLDDFRIWKILLELSSGLKHIHDSGYIHLDIKPANILITFDGVLKIADFGVATECPAHDIDGEGDRRYLAPEIFQKGIHDKHDKPNDVFALGLVMMEIAGNIDMPHNGTSWQRLRSDDFGEVPSMVWSSGVTLNRDLHGDPIDTDDEPPTTQVICVSDGEYDVRYIINPAAPRHPGELVNPPKFMVDQHDPDSIHQIILWMLTADPTMRPTINEVYRCFGCQWVEQRARAGATIYEGNWGPSEEALKHHVQDTDMMDTS